MFSKFIRHFHRRRDSGPPRTLEGRVIYADTRKPTCGAQVIVDGGEHECGSFMRQAVGEVDGTGPFKLTSQSGKYFHVRAYPPAGKPYLPFQEGVALASGDAALNIDISLPRGILVQGKIIESPSNKPAAGASVQYEGRCSGLTGIVTGWQATVLSDANGTFQIAVPEGKGALFVYGPSKFEDRFGYTPQHIFQCVEVRNFGEASYRGKRHYVHAWVPLDLNAESELPPQTIAIRRSVPVRGRLVDPSGDSIERALVLSRLCTNNDWTGFCGEPIRVVDGRFELHGLDADDRATVYVLEPRKQLGAAVEIAGTSERSEPLVVQLKKCGRATARFVNPEGKPLAKYQPSLQIVVTPGPGPFSDPERRRNELESDQDFVANFDRENHNPLPITDRRGRCTFPALIPGATYRLPALGTSGERRELDFTVQAGQTLQLPDITVKLD